MHLSHRIHGAGIYANIGGILMGSMLPYIAYMDPSWVYNYLELSNLFFTRHGLLSMDPQCIHPWILSPAGNIYYQHVKS